MSIKNKVQLITYPDSLGGNLSTLQGLLNNQFAGVFDGGVHILPPYPSSGDRGFAPISYFEIDSRFGSWGDLKEIAKTHDVMLDLMVNHVSQKSVYFADYLEKGEESAYSRLFIPVEDVWENKEPDETDLEKIFRRRKFPWSTYEVGATRSAKRIWTTFGKEEPSEQIDIDVKSHEARELLASILQNFRNNNIRLVRLDAIGYVIKKMGTNCFFVEPEINEFIDWIVEVAKENNLELLPEVHSHFSIQRKLSDRGMWIYDFILPYMILEAIVNKEGQRFIDYLRHRPASQFTMLDCHDGIPIKPDLDGIVSSADARKVVDHCLRNGANLSLVFSESYKDTDGFDVHQIRGTWYSMMNCNDDAYIASRALQFFTPGIPQVYYVGLLAGENDTESVRLTGEGREINRHNFTSEEIAQALKKPIVQRLMKLIKLRNTHEAFNGSIQSMDYANGQIIIYWKNERHFCHLHCNLQTNQTQVEYSGENNSIISYNL